MGETEVFKEFLSTRPLFHHKRHLHWLGIEPGPQR